MTGTAAKQRDKVIVEVKEMSFFTCQAALSLPRVKPNALSKDN